MNSILNGLGVGLFWLSWPLQWLYFRRYPLRSRVLLVADGQALMIKSVIGTNQWMLPGGDIKKTETAAASAIREVREEVGVEIFETQLQPLGKRSFKQNGIKYKTVNFAVELSEKPNIHLKKFEVRSYQWVDLDRAADMKAFKEVTASIKRFIPTEQETLL